MTFYHNITKMKFNISECDELVENLSKGDILMYSESGNATLHPVHPDEARRMIESCKGEYEEE